MTSPYENPTLNLVQHRLIFLLLIYLKNLKSNFTQESILLSTLDHISNNI